MPIRTGKSRIRLGTRGSRLARWQADWCADRLRRQGVEGEIVVIQTSGDRVQNQSIVNIGAQGVFTREIQRALLGGEIDLAVHSLKDLPTEPVDGLVLGGVPERGPHRDAFLSSKAASLEELPENSRIGTGSLRRKTQLLNRFGDRFRIDDIRGNVETRLRKLDEEEYDALILAEAGLLRLGFADRICSFLEPPDFLPAVGQGALGLEIRSDDVKTAEIAISISDSATFVSVLAERSMLLTLQGGCLAPIAALASVDGETLTLHGRILSLDGSKMFETTRGSITDPVELGRQVAEELVALGADAILDEIRAIRKA